MAFNISVIVLFKHVCYLFFAMILALLMRRSGLALAVFFLYGLVFEQLLGGLIDFKILNGGTVRYYFPIATKRHFNTNNIWQQRYI